MFVAIDARWLWNRDMNRWQTYNGRVAAVAIDARWLWNRDRVPTIRDGLLRFVAIDARWLWNRDQREPVSSASSFDPVAIDARWLWNRDYFGGTGYSQSCTRSRSMLDGCGIETCPPPSGKPAPCGSRSMLDGCGIETSCTAPPQSRLRCVAIDAR